MKLFTLCSKTKQSTFKHWIDPANQLSRFVVRSNHAALSKSLTSSSESGSWVHLIRAADPLNLESFTEERTGNLEYYPNQALESDDSRKIE